MLKCKQPKKKGEKKQMKINPESLEAVHTHTHTSNLIVELKDKHSKAMYFRRI